MHECFSLWWVSRTPILHLPQRSAQAFTAAVLLDQLLYRAAYISSILDMCPGASTEPNACTCMNDSTVITYCCLVCEWGDVDGVCRGHVPQACPSHICPTEPDSLNNCQAASLQPCSRIPLLLLHFCLLLDSCNGLCVHPFVPLSVCLFRGQEIIILCVCCLCNVVP